MNETWKRLEAAGAVLVRAELPAEARAAADIARASSPSEKRRDDLGVPSHGDTGVSFERLLAQMSPNIRVRYERAAADARGFRGALRQREALMQALQRQLRRASHRGARVPARASVAPPLATTRKWRFARARVPLRVVVAATRPRKLREPREPGDAGGLTPARLRWASEFAAPPGRIGRCAMGLELERAIL